MHKPKVMTVYGTRPEAIKVAPVIKALSQDDRFESVPVSTGQHKEMLEQVNRMFGIEPRYDLGLMKPGQGLNEIVSRAIAGLEEIIENEKPDIIISQGDTSTAMAAALAGFHKGVKIVHLEAGLRTGNIFFLHSLKRPTERSSARWHHFIWHLLLGQWRISVKRMYARKTS